MDSSNYVAPAGEGVYTVYIDGILLDTFSDQGEAENFFNSMYNPVGGGGGTSNPMDLYTQFMTQQQNTITAYQQEQLNLQREIMAMQERMANESNAIAREQLAAQIKQFEQQLAENKRQFNKSMEVAEQQFALQFGLSREQFQLQREQYFANPRNTAQRYGIGNDGPGVQAAIGEDLRRRFAAGLLTPGEVASGLLEQHGLDPAKYQSSLDPYYRNPWNTASPGQVTSPGGTVGTGTGESATPQEVDAFTLMWNRPDIREHLNGMQGLGNDNWVAQAQFWAQNSPELEAYGGDISAYIDAMGWERMQPPKPGAESGLNPWGITTEDALDMIAANRHDVLRRWADQGHDISTPEGRRMAIQEWMNVAAEEPVYDTALKNPILYAYNMGWVWGPGSATAITDDLGVNYDYQSLWNRVGFDPQSQTRNGQPLTPIARPVAKGQQPSQPTTSADTLPGSKPTEQKNEPQTLVAPPPPPPTTDVASAAKAAATSDVAGVPSGRPGPTMGAAPTGAPSGQPTAAQQQAASNVFNPEAQRPKPPPPQIQGMMPQQQLTMDNGAVQRAIASGPRLPSTGSPTGQPQAMDAATIFGAAPQAPMNAAQAMQSPANLQWFQRR